jgi:hypothetical protein
MFKKKQRATSPLIKPLSFHLNLHSVKPNLMTIKYVLSEKRPRCLSVIIV